MKKVLELLDERDIKYEPIGEHYRALCPFHNDTGKPNFTVFPETNSWYCFRCDVGGSPVDFIIKYDECNVREALKRASVTDPGIRVRLKTREEKNKSIEDTDFRKQVHIRISKLLHEGFKTVGNEKMFELMRLLDNRLSNESPISYDESKRMTEFFKKELQER